MSTFEAQSDNARIDMKESKFFNFVWHINGLIIFVAGILAIAILLYAGYVIAKELTRDREVRNVVNVEKTTEANENWRLGRLMTVSGTPYSMVPLHSNQSYAQSYYSKSSSSTRNYLFVDAEVDSKHWLLDASNFLIAETEYINSDRNNNEYEVVLAILYVTIKTDSNNDDRITTKDLKTIAFSKPNGRSYKEVLTNIDILIGHKKKTDNSLMLLYQRNGIGYSANLSLDDFTLSNETQLPKVGN